MLTHKRIGFSYSMHHWKYEGHKGPLRARILPISFLHGHFSTVNYKKKVLSNCAGEKRWREPLSRCVSSDPRYVRSAPRVQIRLRPVLFTVYVSVYMCKITNYLQIYNNYPEETRSGEGGLVCASQSSAFLSSTTAWQPDRWSRWGGRGARGWSPRNSTPPGSGA